MSHVVVGETDPARQRRRPSAQADVAVNVA
jgi:hypothetical protein